jgi:hypothetical protein
LSGFPEGFPLSQILPKEFIMLPNEQFALECRAYYDKIGLVVDERNGQFAHCPYPKSMGETGYYLLWGHHQQQGLLQSKDIGKRCFWQGDAKWWLDSCDPMPEDYFGLWDIYKEFVSGKHSGGYGRGLRGELNPNYGKKNPKLSERNRNRPKESHPMWGRVGAMRGLTGDQHPRSKKIEVIFPDGSKKLFVSGKEASLSLGGNQAHMTRWARENYTPTRGKFSGYTFIQMLN